MTSKYNSYCNLKIFLSLVATHLVLAGAHEPALAQDERPSVRENMAFQVYCPKTFDGENKRIDEITVQTSEREELACGTGGLTATGVVRKNENGFWLIELRRGVRTIDVQANYLGPPNHEETGLRGTIFTVTDVGYNDWLKLRAAPAPFSGIVKGIPRLQDNLRATGRVAQWKSSRWIEIEYIADLGWVRATNASNPEAKTKELIFSNTTTNIGWVNARYLKEAETDPPPDVGASTYFGDNALEDSVHVPDQKMLLSVFGYRDSDGKYWRVPAGYVTDGASIPDWLQPIVGDPFDEDHLGAAIVHDYFCDVRRRTWRETHEVFYEALRSNNVSVVKSNAMYFAVERFGPRWVEQRVDCRFVCGEHGEVAAFLKPEFNQADWQEGLRKARDPNVTLEELGRLADRQLQNPDAMVRYELATMSDIGHVETKTESRIAIRDLTEAEYDPDDPDFGTKYLVVDQLLDRDVLDKVHNGRGERGVTGPIR